MLADDLLSCFRGLYDTDIEEEAMRQAQADYEQRRQEDVMWPWLGEEVDDAG